MSSADNPGLASQRRPWRDFLTAERVRLYAGAVLVAHIASFIGFVLLDMFLQRLTPLSGNDFRVFWAASRLALDGHGLDAYDIGRLFPLQQLVAPGLVEAKAWQHWFYPPPFLLAVLPLALLPYYLSFLVFNAAGLCFFLRVLRAIIPHRTAAIVALSAPAILFTVVNGQNSLFTASLAGLALTLLERRPALAGVLIGLLVVKPHLALLFAVALVAGKAWRTLCWAAISGLSLLGTSMLVFSPQSMITFFRQVQVAKSFSEQGLLPVEKMPTVFAGMRLLGFDVGAANWVHATVALATAAAVGWLWARPAPPYLRKAALVLGSLLISPHLFDYDLVWLAWPVAWLTVHALQHGWERGELLLLLLAWTAPALGGLLAQAIKLQVTPLLIVLLLAMLVRRAWAHGRSESSLARVRRTLPNAPLP